MDMDRGRRFRVRVECVLLATVSAAIAVVLTVHGVSGWKPDRQQEVMEAGIIEAFLLSLVTSAIGPWLVRKITLQHRVQAQIISAMIGLGIAGLAGAIYFNCLLLVFLLWRCGFEPNIVIAASVMSVGLMTCERGRHVRPVGAHMIGIAVSILLAVIIGTLARRYMESYSPPLLRRVPVSAAVRSPDASMVAQVFYTMQFDEGWRDDLFGEMYSEEFTIEVRKGGARVRSCVLEHGGRGDGRIADDRYVTYQIEWQPGGNELLLNRHETDEIARPPRRCLLEGDKIQVVRDDPPPPPQKPR